MLYPLKPLKPLTGRYIINTFFLQIVPYTGIKIVPAAEPLYARYFVIEGKDAEWTKGSDAQLRFRLNSADLLKVLIDGVEVEFTVADDGTVTLASAVLEALDAGEHEITFVFADGSCSTHFTVK